MDQTTKQKKEELERKRLMKFLSVLIDEIDFQRRNQEDVAKELGIGGGSFSKNLSGKSQFNFWNMIKLLNILYDADVLKKKEMLHRFCLVSKSKQNMRIAMEYANAKGDLELLKLVVDKEKTSSLAINREWAYVYELVWMRSKGIVSGKALLEKLEDRKSSKVIKTQEMKVLYGILTFYTMYDLEKFNSLFEYAEVLQPEVEEIPDDFIRTAYSGRIKEGLSYAYLMQDNVGKSRELCHEILHLKDDKNCFSLLRASALVYLAESYTFESYERASWYITKSLEMLSDCHFERAIKRRENILNTHAFIKLVHNLGLNDIQIFHPAEDAFLEIRKGNYKLAEEILNNIKKERGYLVAIEYTYLGLATNDVELIEKSISMFECEGNRFYCKFPRKMLVEFNKNGIIYMGDAK
ncbi:AimR family lysis-lysogeny pheromone receptor [Bacillus thuringiensis]|uniref:AimR family lysis-lysogeny pheromone receptor n=1 Tax=Bacillus thuringiensis TaxID=1428 RepID=UPI0026E1506B|nr:AimR family lysis-lysogeny pheromone receptor [Bacillus thuringiensis]MDO6633217.1 AimR family lysis-lysogeny pheromone receptor [Bacillus thuringiensis]MDO6662591.1 AimR family lysis-lysogeny pheromone receptor [Bacillus thuringiensis]MDO6703446.1 AimR family lysis-lysogeny pheromone receptor [Bacillus thuringiensis]